MKGTPGLRTALLLLVPVAFLAGCVGKPRAVATIATEQQDRAHHSRRAGTLLADNFGDGRAAMRSHGKNVP